MSAESLRIAPLAGWAALLIAGCVVGVLLDRSSAVPILSAVLCVPFLFVALLRSAALVHVFKEYCSEPPVTSAVDASCLPEVLPRYAILVPLYKEAEVIGQLIEGLRALDYPANRLQISLIVEVDDASTRAAIARQVLPANVRVVIVPRGNPRTKPRALNHALADAIGDYVVVYDAEDLPNPGQLREALAVLISDPENTGCVQARLNIYNAEQNAITRQFAIEYNALFGAILPMLGRFGLPIPLGGTSNHFPRRTLERAGGWDAHNVTEDADLGIRLARLGYNVRVISSTTWEEAPGSLRVWTGQRTRWLKGWMQTYLVHMRHPRRLWRELGTFRFLGFQVMMGGMILSALVHPWFLVILGHALFFGGGLAAEPSTGGDWLVGLSVFNLLAGYATAMALGALTVTPENRRVAWHVFGMPVYWVVISFAAYRALWQLAFAPFLWEKTPHHGRRIEQSGKADVPPIDGSMSRTSRAR
jgi:cellulose synthase/poly-beta-1,6-N-acetylglucosamine synthase-like glycosyltransferase